MGLISKKLSRPHIWKRLLVERFSEPLHLNIMSLFVAVFGTVRAKIFFDLYVRHQHAFGLLTAADAALASGHKRVTAIEFGVASGAGLLNMCKIAEKITKATGVSFDIYGFDNVSGMPPLRDYRDHPELYQPGWFPMEDPEKLRARLPSNAHLIFGDIAATVPEFLSTHSADSPIGFVSVDVDYYWSAVECLKCLTGPPEHYLSQVTMYLDDIHHATHNPWCGEYAAIHDFNEENEFRKIAPFNFLREYRLFKKGLWISQMYSLNVLDHPYRFRASESDKRHTIPNPYL